MAVNKNFTVRHGLEVNTSLILADANTNKVGIGSTAPRFELDVAGGIGATDFYLSGIGTFTNELNVGTDGSVLTALGIGGSVGVGTALPAYLLDVRSETSTGTTALYVQGDVKITGDLTVDDITFDQADINYLNVTGLATIAQLGVSGLTTSTNLIVSGVSTFSDYVDFNDNVDISGTLNVGGATTLSGYVDINNSVDISNDLNISGIATIATVDINAGDIEVSNVDTTNLNVTGIATIATISVIGAELTNLNVTGVTTLGTVQVSSGIVTATTGIVTYYGDGSQLDGVIGGIGINTEGGLVGFGITYLHLFGAGVSTTFYDSSVGIATIFLEGGGGGGSVSISSVAPLLPENGDLWYSIDYGRTFVYYDEVALGIGSTAVWVDAAPFNIGIVDIDNLTVGDLTVTNSASITGLAVTNLIVTNIYATGIATITNSSGTVTVGVGTTALLVEGNARVTGILTVGSSSVTIDGISDEIRIGNSLTINSSGIEGSVNLNVGVVTATSFFGDGSGLTGAGSTVADDTSTNATFYPLFTQTTSGTVTDSKVSTTKLTFNPSSGTVSATTFSGALSGNSTTASTLQTSRTINGVSFNGSANIVVNPTSGAYSNGQGAKTIQSGGTASGGSSGDIYYIY